MGEASAFRRHLARVVLLLLPVCYVAQLSATAVHEFLGHGLAAILVGGRFTGVELAWDGMGSATAHRPVPGSVAAEVIILVAGVVSTCVTGLLLLAISVALRNGAARWILLVFSACLILEGAPYAFWSAWQLGEHGDIARMLAVLPSVPEGRAEIWRTVILVAGGVLGVIGSVLPVGGLLRGLEASFPAEVAMSQGRRIVFAAGVGILGVASWWLFDWEQLLPGVGVSPSVVGSGLIVGTVAWFVFRDRRDPREAIEVTGMQILAWWLLAVSLAAATLLWLGAGVSWA